MLNAIEVRNPFLSKPLLDYASELDVNVLLIGRRREMKLALRKAYGSVLGEIAKRPKLIARETMGIKQMLREYYGNSPYVYRRWFKEIFNAPEKILPLIREAKNVF